MRAPSLTGRRIRSAGLPHAGIPKSATPPDSPGGGEDSVRSGKGGTGSSPRGGGRKREGSRLFLAVALAAVVAAALFLGSRVADILSDLAGLASPGLRLAIKVGCVAVALPAGFYLVERLFLGRTSRRRR